MKIIKLTAIIMVVFIAFSSLTTAADAATYQALGAADALFELGLFKGIGNNADGTPNYNLDGRATRETAATIIVRLIGKESEALGKSSYTMPFSDVSSWALQYVGWAYTNGYISGTSPTTFSGKTDITAQQYLTLLLRVLGYSESAGDFTYAGACAFAAKIGLTDGSYTNYTKNFTRGDIAVISYAALGLKMKNSENTLYKTYFGKELPQPAQTTTMIVYTNTAPGTVVYKNSGGNVIIDASNTKYGYVMISSKLPDNPKLVVMITGPDGLQYKYFYTDTAGVYQAFPLTAGSGSYKVGIYLNVSGTKYSTLHSATINVTLTSSLVPFLRPNFFVDYNVSTACVAYASTLCRGATTELEKVERIYNYIIKNFTYDYSKAASVTTGYRPSLDTVWKTKKGICFDYAALMAAMLRTQVVATKLVVGYAGTVYHAWISVYSQEAGWVEAVIYFDGSNWRLMDPTFASTGGDSVTDYITNDKNYTAKYIY